MIRKLTALALALALLAGSALAEVVYTYPAVTFTGWLGDTPTHPMQYVNQFYYADGSYSPMGERLLKWLDMNPREDRSGSGYLMLEKQYHHQTSFGQTLGHYVRWTLDRGAETVSSVGLNLVKNAAEHQLYKTKFGKAGAYALPYYQMLRETYAAYVTHLERRITEADLGIKLLGDVISPAYTALAKALEEPEIPDRVLVTSSPDQYALGDEVVLHITSVSRNPRMDDLPIVTQMTAVEKLPDGSIGATFPVTLDDVAMETLNGHKVILDVTDLDSVQRDILRNGILQDVGEELITATGDFDAGFWYRRLDPLTFDYYKQTLLKSERYQNLPANQKKELDEVLAAREEMLQKPDRSPLNKTLDRVGLAMDFMSAVESWHSYFSQKKDLTLQEQAYLQIVTSVTQEHLDLLIAWEERVWEDPNLSVHEKECICGALAALMLEVAATGDETLNALAQNNASLASFSAKADAAASTTEFIINLLGAAKNDPLAASGGLGAAVIGAQVVDLFITLIGGEEYFDAYEKVRALHDLQASLTTQVLSRLETYRFHRSDALANAIISELNLIKEIKLVGEELVMMYYLSDFCSELGLENAPTMFAVLMEEVLQAPSSHEMDAKGSCQRMWGVYQREATLDVLLGQVLNAAQVESDPLGCFPEVYAAGDTTAMASMTDTLLGYYQMEGQPVTFNGAALEALPQIYESRVGALPEKYLNLPGSKVPFGTLSQMPGSAYQGVVKEDPSWRQRQLPEIDSLNSVFVEPVYLYQKGSTMAVFSENEWLAYQKVEERVEEMLKRYDGSNPEDHQTEERLMWGRLTNHYIESFKMYDPQGDYPLNPPLKP